MRFLLALMAMTLFAVSVGCEKPTDTAPAADPPAAEAEGGDAAAEGGEAAEGDGASAAAAGETQTVSLKVPGMT